MATYLYIRYRRQSAAKLLSKIYPTLGPFSRSFLMKVNLQENARVAGPVYNIVACFLVTHFCLLSNATNNFT